MLAKFFIKKGQPADRVIRVYERLSGEHLPVELIEVDSLKGKVDQELYDIIATPQILVVSSDGHVVKQWMPEELPVGEGDVRYFLGLNTQRLYQRGKTIKRSPVSKKKPVAQTSAKRKNLNRLKQA